MNDLIAAAATIQGAQIQANYALLAAVISSLVGAGGIIFAANFAFKSGLKTQQHNNILEAKREVYLDVVGSGSLFLSYLKRFPRINERFFDDYAKYSDDFLSQLNAILVVCDEKNKDSTKALIEDFISISEMADSNLFYYMTFFNKTKKDEVEIERKNELSNELFNNIELITSEYLDKDDTYNKILFEFNSSIERDAMRVEINRLRDKRDILRENRKDINSQLKSMVDINNNEKIRMHEIEKFLRSIIENQLSELEKDFDKLTESLKNELL